VNPEAFEYYMNALSQDFSTHQGIEKGQSLLEKAIQKDPGFAPSYISLGWTYFGLGELG
jgi:hypothetical protein